MRLLDYDGLRSKGIKWSKPHLWRKERAGEFPKRTVGTKKKSTAGSRRARQCATRRRRDITRNAKTITRDE